MCGCGLFESERTYVRTYSRVVACIFLQRHPTMYVSKVLLLMTLSTLIGVANALYDKIYWQLSLLMTVFFSNAGLLNVTNATIPNVAYLTCIEKLNMVAFLLVF